MDYYLFVIDTLEYAGNFDRQLTAWCTGVVGECEFGKEYAFAFTAAFPQSLIPERVLSLPDTHGCHRPCVPYPTPGWSNDGHGNHFFDTVHPYPAYQSVAIFFEELPTAYDIDFLQRRASSYRPLGPFDSPCTITGYRVLHHQETERCVALYPVIQAE